MILLLVLKEAAGVHDVRQMGVHTVESLIAEPSLVEVEIAIGKLKRWKSKGTDHIPAELIKAERETLRSERHRLIHLYGIKRNCHSSGRNLLLYQFIERVVRLAVIIVEESRSYQLRNILLARLTSYVSETIGDHQFGFRRNRSTTDKIFYIRQILEKK
jgi:hypothetical protein